jgi:type I restriction enzyme, S subunit
MTNWPVKTLDSMFRVCSSKRVLKSEWKQWGVPFYRGREITALSKHGFVENELFIAEEHFSDLSQKYGVPKTGDIMITAIGTIGNSYVVREADRFYFKDASVIWLDKQAEIMSAYVDYWIGSSRFRDQLNAGNGATVDTLTISGLSKMQIPVPPLAEQKRIVALLDAATARVTELTACYEQARTHVNNLFISASRDALEGNPDWPIKTLGDVCDVIAGQSPEGKFYNKDGKGVPFYQGKKDFAERVLGSPTTWTSEVTKLARPGDILMSVRAPVGPVNLCPIEACIGRGLAAIRPSSKTDTDFIYYYLESIQSEIAGTEGAVFASINKAQIEGLRCPVPPLEEQKQIVARLDSIRAKTLEMVAANDAKLTAAKNLRQSILEAAFAEEL